MLASGTAHRGVEAKECDMADTMDENCNSQCDSVARASSTHTHTVDETNSYIQVVVQKHRRGRGRLPAASSPAAAPPHAPPHVPHTHCRKLRLETEGGGGGGEGGEGGEALLMLQSRPPLLLLPPLAVMSSPALAPRHDTHNRVRNEFPCNEKGDPGVGGGRSLSPCTERPQKGKPSWKMFHLDENNLVTPDCGPERFEVYYFESAEVSQLATRAARRTAVERAASGARRRAAAMLDELLAAARLALAAPIALLLALLRCMLELQLGAVSGVVSTLSDYALTPALALLYNAVLRPPLVCARALLRPACGMLADVLEPLTRVLGALRLVHVHVERAPCRCARRHCADDDNERTNERVNNNVNFV
ncbi:uncharacterized protein LOC128683452 isoform X2 [Plodia interpunctella]|uniref:uncharacterized protein LOC128683452 isoform X2 n=1 Tax=Plodia interpunctella TaxID=58824 RepID=UPI002368DD38|nr:uncharacterized protein LOC128683452 isoform X2 [Plodia interpunctella]